MRIWPDPDNNRGNTDTNNNRVARAGAALFGWIRSRFFGPAPAPASTPTPTLL